MFEQHTFRYFVNNKEKSIKYGLSRDGHIVLCSIEWERLRADAAQFVGIDYADFIRIDAYQTVEQVLSLLSDSSREHARERVLSAPGSPSSLSPKSSVDLWTRRLSRYRSSETSSSPEDMSGLIKTSSNELQTVRRHNDSSEHSSQSVAMDVSAPNEAALLQRSASGCYSGIGVPSSFVMAQSHSVPAC
mmetsp:Transcript_35015/g.56673  ORF Transcript_35015/g.56673 Transcript_35015/m.56673 type:complete len:189 (+) Transcript_35015:358-924(+)|eukprot:CAMPEP_0184672308 /NCGR_PEP_ID=MMETSP0308-20130426/86023_1 /TAXON_ID=38269 /ORGANISM="Gloeochaete witrockiana, Strain SAG 46.84" /LENGTH=188 /DNA_ID=CAMNT_0027119611 /DNA_START=330 /DNA_END=896 /DNA_ORIENTATION=-